MCSAAQWGCEWGPTMTTPNIHTAQGLGYSTALSLSVSEHIILTNGVFMKVCHKKALLSVIQHGGDETWRLPEHRVTVPRCCSRVPMLFLALLWLQGISYNAGVTASEMTFPLLDLIIAH